MKSAAYYVRKGMRYSIHYYLKHPARLFLCLAIELAKILSLPFLVLNPSFAKMQFNHTKMLYETRDASYSKSFDDADKNYLNRFLFCTVFFFLSLVISGGIFGFIYLISFLIKNILTNFLSTSQMTAINPFFNVLFVFGIILSSLVLIYCFINFTIGNFISCASNTLSLGDVLYNTLLTMKKNTAKILLVFLLYFLFLFSFIFIFGFPSLILYSFLHTNHLKAFNIFFSIIIALFSILSIFLLPIFITGMRISLFEVYDICAELDQRVVVVNKKDLRGNTIRVNVLPYEEKSKRLDVDLSELPLYKKRKKKGNEESGQVNRDN